MPSCPPLDKAKVKRIIRWARMGLGTTEIADREQVSGDTVIKYRRRAGIPSPVKRAAEADPVERQRLKEEAEAKRQEHINAIKELSFRGFLGQLFRDIVKPLKPGPVARAPKRHREASERFPMLALTDWHFEEVVKAEGVLGLNKYDIPTACTRIHRVVHKLIEWKRDREAGGCWSMPELTVACLGDMLTGTLHGLERHSDAPNVVKAVLACGDLLALVLRDLAAHFPKVRVVGVSGNHGRLPDDKKVPTKDPTRSWDYFCYEIARRRLGEQPNVEWHLPEAYGVLFDVAGHTCYASHGNFIPNNLGVVGYGVRRFTSSLASNLQAAGKPLRYAFFGHWHAANSSEFAGVEAFICPALIGTQEYSFLSGGQVNRSAQELHVFSRELGWVSKERLYGDGATQHIGTYPVEV